MTLAIIFDNIVMCCASVGSSLELFILIFLVFNFKNKVSIFSSSYFRLLAVGYFIDLIFFSPLAAFTLLSVDDTYFTMFTKRYCELYVVLFIGPWNLALCLNRLSSIAFVNKHQSLWSNKKLIFLHILLFAFPFIISTFSFLQAECKSLIDSDGCFDFIYENFYIISVSNGIFIFSSLGTGISTFVVLSRKNKRNSVINLKIKHTKIERNLLLQSFISSIFYGSFCISLAVYPYFSSHRHISSYYAAYNTVIFLENILYMLFHYSSFISLLVFSPTMRSNLIKFYHLHIFTCQNHRRPALSSIIFLANKKV